MPLINYGKKRDELWFIENLHGNAEYAVKVNKVLTEEESPFQHLQIFDTARLGKILVLDGIVQTSSVLEFSAPYGEMLAHVPLISHPNPQRGLIIGGGDYEIAREVFKHLSVEHLDLVDIDRRVGELTLEHMSEFTGGAEKDSRLHVHSEDGAEFVKNVPNNHYDFVLIDSTDPGGPSTPLFNARFIRNVYRILKPGGIVARQVGSLQFQPDEAPSNFRCIQSIFGEASLYISSIPIYWGGLFGFVIAVKSGALAQNLDFSEIKSRFEARNLDTIYYSPEIHQAAFLLPPYIKKRLETVYGCELIMEIEGCDLDITDAEERCKEFVERLCEKINMKRFGGFQYYNFGHAKSKTSGPSFVQLIETSSIVGHVSNYWDGTLYLDLFTCKDFDPQVAVDFAREFFGARVAFSVFLERGSVRNSARKKLHVLGEFCSERKNG
ncbi:MAG: polyamine aminopropyltransferase [Candidatus Zambryskibacteria bacterium]|nr:polyamine aminopropyltransferase [Candidatus Zambryskibacteria bacterium]QQG46386.1 MAG: polyamine aminopropyltransferase [Candidatus Niyogibacteria bacterium]